MDVNFPYITRQDIVNFPFPYKLWLVVNLEYCDFLRWNRDGTVVLLDLVALVDYLNSTRSIFKIKNSSSFLQHLEEFKFERLNATPEAEEDLLLQYRNENFQRHRLDLLAKIRRHTYQLIGLPPTDNYAERERAFMISSNNLDDQCANISKCVSDRMLGDLCFMFHGGLSKIKRSRLRFQTLLHFHKETRILKEKLTASDAIQNIKSKPDVSIRSAAATTNTDEEQVIELPVELFENPHDSVLNLGGDFRPEYAGYYGNCSKDQILHFFGEYLPMYEDNSTEVKKIVTDNGTVSGNNTLSMNAEPNIMQYSSSTNVTEKPNIYISTPTATSSIYNLNFSSNLEPIYITDEKSENIYSNSGDTNNDFTATQLNSSCLDNETDISMEEFIKFKDVKNMQKSNENVSVDCQQLNSNANDCATYSCHPPVQVDINALPQMPTSVKQEITENVHENEANFRNFFSQYRASLNLLYERQ